MSKWKSAEYPGVRYYEHTTRKYKRKADRYYAIRYQINGNQKEESVGWMSEGWTAVKAHNLLATLKRNIKSGTSPQSLAEMREMEQRRRDQAERERYAESITSLTFADLAEMYIPWARDVSQKSSWKTDQTYLAQHILPEIGDKIAANVTRSDIEQMRQTLESKTKADGTHYAPATVKQSIAICRQVFRWAANTQASDEDPNLRLYNGTPPTKGVKMPSVDNQREAFFTQDQARALFAALQNPPAELRKYITKRRGSITPLVHDVALFSLWTGHRLETCVQTRKRWVNIDTGVIITPGNFMKAQKRHHAYFEGTPLQTVLQKRMRGSSPLLFPSLRTSGVADGAQISRTVCATVDWLGMNEGAENNLERLVFHSLRHTFASWHAMNGTDILTLRDLMGHSTLKQTERYAHLMPSRHRDAARSLGRSYSASASSS